MAATAPSGATAPCTPVISGTPSPPNSPLPNHTHPAADNSIVSVGSVRGGRTKIEQPIFALLGQLAHGAGLISMLSFTGASAQPPAGEQAGI